MTQRVFRCLPISLFSLVLLLSLAVSALAQEGPRATPQARAASRGVDEVQAKGCPRCAFVQEKCSATCFGEAEKGQMGSCLTACDNAAATCSCDEAVTLRSEDLFPDKGASLFKDACHGNVSCQPAFPSCASWTSYSDCGTPFCGTGVKCGDCECDEFGRCFCGPGPAWKTPRERFRVCFDSGGNPCTEWQTFNFSSCGC